MSRPKLVTHRMSLLNVTSKRMELRLWRYGFIVLRSKSRKRKGSLFTVYVGRKNDSGETESLLKLILSSELSQPEPVANELAKSNDEYLSLNALQIAEALVSYIKNWNELLRKKELEKILDTPLNGYELDTTSTIDLESLKKVEFDEILSLISNLLNPKIAELLEIVMSIGLTLKQVDRSKGVVDNRPVWLSIVADPSTYKTSTLRLLSESKYVVFAQNFTPASLLPAKQDVEPLIELMHNHVFIIPTLSEETADKEIAKKVFSALESVYDGEYAKSTGLSGFRKEYVDTVIVAAVTPAVWEWVLPYIVNIGSRWLVYRYMLNDADALVVQRNLEGMKELPKLRTYVSKYFDFLLDNVNYTQLKEAQIPENYEKDLEDLARLVARLRAVWKIETYWEVDEDTGRKTVIKEVEVIQVEAPSRAYQQIKNFVRANTLLRKSSVQKIVGLPVVDEHAMKLAAELAIGSTTNQLKDIILYLAKKQAIGEETLIRLIASNLGLSRSTTERLIKVLKHPRVDLIDDDWKVKEPFYSLIKKYLLSSQDQSRSGA